MIGGAIAAAGAAVCFDGAVILQAQEARVLAARHGLRMSLLRRLAARPRWLAGTALAIAGWPLQLLALSLAPLTVVQPALALGLVLLLVVGGRVLGESIGPREWAGAGSVIAGVVLIATVAPAHTEHVPAAGTFAVAGGALALVVLLPMVVGRARAGAWGLIASAGAAFALAALTSKLVTVELARGDLLAALAWTAATAAAAGVGLLVDMTALQRFSATRVAPPMFVLETALPVALAPPLFAERWADTTGGGVVLVGALALVLAGGALLGARRWRDEEPPLEVVSTPGRGPSASFADT